MSLQSRIVASLSLVALIFAVLTMLLFATQESTLRTDARESSEYLAQNLGQQIDRLMAERYREVQMMSRNRSMQPADLNHAVAISDMVSVSAFLSLSGDIIATNSKDAHGKTIDTAWMRDRNFSNRRWFADAKAGRFTKGTDGLSGTVAVGPYNEKAVAEATGSDGLVVAFSTPVLSDGGQPIGVLVNFVPFDRIEQILFTGYDALKTRGIDQGELFLLDETGVVLADVTAANHQDYKRNYDIVGKTNLVEAGLETATDAVKNKQHGIGSAPGSHIDAYNYSTGAGDYPGLGWTVLVRAPKSELFGHIGHAANMLYGGMLLLLAALVGLTVKQGDTLTQGIAGPLSLVKQQADMFNVATGALIADALTAANTLRSNTEQLSAQINDTKRNATRMTERATNSAKTAAETTTMAEAIDGALWKLSTQVKKTSTAASEVGEVSTRSAKSLKALSGRAIQIHDALQGMATITSQLHMLALNATIESSRGEASGFSMVANELKTLANYTAKATDVLTAHLQRFEENVRETIGDVGTIQDAVYDITKTTEITHAAIEKQHACLAELISSLKQLSEYSAEIAQTIVTVEMSTSDGAGASERAHATAAALKERLGSVKEKLDTFFTTIRAA